MQCVVDEGREGSVNGDGQRGRGAENGSGVVRDGNKAGVGRRRTRIGKNGVTLRSAVICALAFTIYSSLGLPILTLDGKGNLLTSSLTCSITDENHLTDSFPG